MGRSHLGSSQWDRPVAGQAIWGPGGLKSPSNSAFINMIDTDYHGDDMDCTP